MPISSILIFLDVQKTTPKKRKVQEIEISSDEEEESPHVPLNRQKLKKVVPAPEPRPKTKIKITATKSRPPPVVIREPTEQEVAARLNNPSESDNSSPGAEVPLQVFTSTYIYLFPELTPFFTRILRIKLLNHQDTADTSK